MSRSDSDEGQAEVVEIAETEENRTKIAATADEEGFRQIIAAQTSEEAVTEPAPKPEAAAAEQPVIAKVQAKPKQAAKPSVVPIKLVRPSAETPAEIPKVPAKPPAREAPAAVKPGPDIFRAAEVEVSVVEQGKDDAAAPAAQHFEAELPPGLYPEYPTEEQGRQETSDDTLVIDRDDLLRDLPELAALYSGPASEAEPEEAEPFEPFDTVDYMDGLPLEARLELKLFEYPMDEDSSEVTEGHAVLFEVPEERADLATMLQSLEPEQAEAVQPVLSIIVQMAREIRELPDSGDELAGETERAVLEQALEQWCARLFEHLDIDANDEAIRQFAQLMINHESDKPVDEESVIATDPTDKGTHERKVSDGLAALSRLAHDIKHKLHLLLWMGRHALRVATTARPRLAIGEASL